MVYCGKLRLKSCDFLSFFVFASFFPTKATLCVLSSLCFFIPAPNCFHPLLFPLFCGQTIPQPSIATVLSIFNYDRTVLGFETLNRHGHMSRHEDKCRPSNRFMLPSEVIGQGKNNTGWLLCSFTHLVLHSLKNTYKWMLLWEMGK